ncbi:unnamed protein product [Calypogeia fissa]
MEESFKSRVEQVFGGLLGSAARGLFPVPSIASSSASGVANSWSVSEVAIPCNQGSKVADESSGSESDEPRAARYEKFVKLAKRARRRQGDEDEEGFDKEIDIDDLDDLDDDRATKRRRGEDPEEPDSAAPEDVDEEEECRQVRLMVGMDDTLDFEEEEDEYDKVAVGREDGGERVYMREVTGVSSDMSPLTPLPESIPGSERRKFQRDARANHAAAVARLEEDDRLATINNSEVARMLRLSSSSGSASKREPSGNGADDSVFSHSGGSSSLKNIKPVLKSIGDLAGNGKADAQSNKLSTVVVEDIIGIAHENALQKELSKDTNSLTKHGESGTRIESKSKRVRFSEDDHVIVDKKRESASGRDMQKVGEIPMSKNRYGRVPDHVLNPSKYTHYTLEWSDDEDDNKANLAAFQATQAMARAAEEKETPGIVELPKSITFTPRGGGAMTKGNGEAKISTGAGFQQSQALVSFAEEVLTDNSPRPEDASHSSKLLNASTETKTARVFRKRAREEEMDDINAEGEGP